MACGCGLPQECCEGAGESILDVVDYCHRQVVTLLAGGERPGIEEVGREEGDESDDEEEEEKKRQICKVRRRVEIHHILNLVFRS